MTCKILSFDQTISYENTISVTLPGSKGEFEILPRHAEIFQLLSAGKITINLEGDKTKNYQIQSGGCHFLDNILTIVLPSSAVSI